MNTAHRGARHPRTLHIHITEAMHAQLAEIAKRTRVPTSRQVRRMLHGFITSDARRTEQTAASMLGVQPVGALPPGAWTVPIKTREEPREKR